MLPALRARLWESSSRPHGAQKDGVSGPSAYQSTAKALAHTKVEFEFELSFCC